MQPQQPTQPPVIVSDTTLALLWKPHLEAIERAKAAGGLAVPLEQSAARRWATAKEHRLKAEQIITEAADLEASATADEKQAQTHRQDEQFHLDTANEVANNVAFLVATNKRMHPAEKAERDAQMAAANAADPLTVQIGSPLDRLVSASPLSDNTAPIAAGEQL